MLNSLESYRRDVERHLSSLPPVVRQGELEEISAHLEQLSADFVGAGHDSEQANALAIARFGTARSVGLRLRDVWEGNRGAALTFAFVIASNWLLQIVNVVAGARVFVGALMSNRALMEAINPLLVMWVFWTLVLLPLGCNFVLGRWGGRRVVAAALLTYLPLWPFYSTSYSGSSEMAISIVRHLPYMISLIIFMAFIGAWSGVTWQRRQRFVIVDGASIEQVAAVLLKPRRVPLRRILMRGSAWLLGVGLVSAVAWAVVKPRVNDVLHPPTPEAAVRVLLSDPARNFGEVEPATNVSTRLLPPETAAERAGIERRVAYTATMRASKDFRQRRIAFLQKRLRLGKGRYAGQDFRAAIARLRLDSYAMRGIARVKKTPHGWRVDTSGSTIPSDIGSSPGSSPEAWLYYP